MLIRELAVNEDRIISLIAERMRLTLIEVLGEERGAAMYELDWLLDRVRFHLDPDRSNGCVFVAEDEMKKIAGHTIVRMESASEGLFSTTYVAPEYRGRGVASALIAAGEEWLLNKGAKLIRTNTHPANTGLIQLFINRSYALNHINEDFVSLTRVYQPLASP